MIHFGRYILIFSDLKLHMLKSGWFSVYIEGSQVIFKTNVHENIQYGKGPS